MAFAGVSFIVDGKLCDFTLSPVDAGADSGYHLLVVQGYSRTKGTTPNEECIESRPFLVGGHRWIVEYYPNGYDQDSQNYMSVFLDLDEDVSQGVEAQYAFSFIDQPELRVSTLIRRRERHDFSTVPSGFYKFMQNEVLERSRHLKNDSFVIRCDVVVVKPDNNIEEQGAGTTSPVLVQVPPSDMQSHFSNLLFTKEGADITFEVGGKKFAAHRFVLAARSTVFKAQLFGALDGGATVPNVLRIDDIGVNVFRRLLIFIYTDAYSYEAMEEDEGDNTEVDGAEEEYDEAEEEDNEAEESSEGEEVDGATRFLLELLEAAVRYDLQKLKSICEEILGSRHICATSVADIIVVAERSRCRWLKELCLEFIKSHTSLHKVLGADCLYQIIRTASSSGLKELISKFPAS